jgi:hypothetical protein
MKHDLYSANSIRLARVTHVHPEGQKMEVIFLDTGDYGRDVQLMSPYAGSDFGFTTGIPMPEKEGHAENLHDDPDRRHIIALVANLQGMHIALGFIFPQITEMAFTKAGDKNRMIERHPSDFYRTISDSADMDMVHPGGAFIRIGQGKAATALTGKDFDKRWKIRHNTGKHATITSHTSSISSNSIESSQITLEPNGNISSDATKNIASVSGKATSVQAGTSVDVQSGTTTTLASGKETSISAGTGIAIAATKQLSIDSMKAMSIASATTMSLSALSLSAIFSGSMWEMGKSGFSMSAPFVDMAAQKIATIRAPDINLEGTTHIIGDIDI